MTLIDNVSRRLLSPARTGFVPLLWAIVAIAVPTGMQAAVSEFVSGIPFLTYIPFVLLSAILLSWAWAAVVAIVSAFVADFFFVGPPSQLLESPTDVVGVAVFLLSSGLTIFLVETVRSIVENTFRPARGDGLASPVVFSLKSGQAWASWYGSHSWVRLGPQDEVAEMMEDFLAQMELGKRLNRAMG